MIKEFTLINDTNTRKALDNVRDMFDYQLERFRTSDEFITNYHPYDMHEMSLECITILNNGGTVTLDYNSEFSKELLRLMI